MIKETWVGDAQVFWVKLCLIDRLQKKYVILLRQSAT